MVSDTPKTQSIMAETTLIRRQADALLARLIENRKLIKQRIHESGWRDPMQTITGHSAMDNAIDTTRELISDADEILIEVSATFSANGTKIRVNAKPSTIAVST